MGKAKGTKAAGQAGGGAGGRAGGRSAPTRVRRPADTAVVVSAVCFGVAFALAVAGALYSFGVFTGEMSGIGITSSLAVLTLLLGLVPVAVLLHSLRRPLQAFRPVVDRRAGEVLAELAKVREEAALSDDARRVLNRSRERELLRRAIQEDIEAGDWDAGVVLANELAERFGYRADAEEFRAKIEQARSETQRRQVDAAISLLESAKEFAEQQAKGGGRVAPATGVDVEA